MTGRRTLGSRRWMAAWAGVVLAAISAAGEAKADYTYWQGPAGRVPDWWLAENWSAGLPTLASRAFIENGGIARIAGGQAEASELRLGNPQTSLTGFLLMEGGELRLAQSLYLYGPSEVTVNGGAMSSDRIQIGYHHGDHASVRQSGGRNVTETLSIGDVIGSMYDGFGAAAELPAEATAGSYTLEGGELLTGSVRVGSVGRGEFHQLGGVHEVSGTLTIGGERGVGLITLPAFAGLGDTALIHVALAKTGIYELRDGELRAREMNIRSNGTLSQVRGELEAGFLSIDEGGRYVMSVGNLDIRGGLRLGSSGTLELGEADVRSEHGLIDLGQGTLTGARHAALELGEGSLLIVPQGFDPRKEFGEFESAGLVHTLGTDLVLKRGSDYSGWWGTLTDHVRVAGTLTAAEDGALNLLGGLDVEKGGSVDLKGGTLRISDQHSSIVDGQVRAAEMTVGGDCLPATERRPVVMLRPEEGRFRQRSGSVEISYQLRVAAGDYELEDGSVAADWIVIGGERISAGPARLIQQDGSVTADVVRVGYSDPAVIRLAQAYEVAGDIRLWPPRRPWPGKKYRDPVEAEYRMEGGELTVGNLLLDESGLFRLAGGQVHVANGIAVDGGTLEVRGGAMEAGDLHLQGASDGPFLMDTAQSSNVARLVLGAEADVRLGEWVLGRNSRVEAEVGATVAITAPAAILQIKTRDAAAMAGLENLTVVFTGGTELEPATLEAAGRDVGPAAGFEDNFALGTLVIGEGDAAAYLRLMDLYGNSGGGEGPLEFRLPEAVYVHRLVVNAGCTLNLNGYNLYYEEADIAPDAVIVGDLSPAVRGETAFIPEPSAAAVLAVVAGLAGCGRRAARTH